MQQKLLVGTTKGLVEFEKTTQGWQISQTHFLGFPVSVIFVNPLNDTWWVGISHHHWGQKLHYTQDKGKIGKPFSLLPTLMMLPLTLVNP